MEERLPSPTVPKSDIGAFSEAGPERPAIWPQLLTFVTGLAAVAAIGAVAWVYTDIQREIVRVSTDIAQIRLSLELYGRQAANGAAPASGEAADSGQLLDLSNRIAILEQNWRNQIPAAGVFDATRLPELPAAGLTAPPSGPTTDCMPQGTRFLVAAGDNYPVCNSPGVIEVASVAAGHVSFVDGTIIPAGGTAILKGTNCTLAVMTSEADGMTGYAELRVTC